LEEGYTININEHNEHFGATENYIQDEYLNISDSIQYRYDIPDTNVNIIPNNVKDVNNVILDLIDQHLISNEHPTSPSRCSSNVNCDSSSQPDEIFSQLFTQNAYDLILTDLSENNLTPLICRSGCKHYDGVTDVNNGLFKELCCYGRSYRLEESGPCDHFEDNNSLYDEEDGILRF
jgi:hypothetical protein